MPASQVATGDSPSADNPKVPADRSLATTDKEATPMVAVEEHHVEVPVD